MGGGILTARKRQRVTHPAVPPGARTGSPRRVHQTTCRHSGTMPNPAVVPQEEPPRRRFLKSASAFLAVASGVLLAIPSLRAFAAPVSKTKKPDKWIKIVDDVNALDVGVPVKVDFVEQTSDAWVESNALRTVWLYTEDGEHFTAFSGVCTHLGCSFTYDEAKKVYACPCHHGSFDPKTGAVLGGPPPRPLDTLPVKVVDGEVHVLFESYRTGIPQKVAE